MSTRPTGFVQNSRLHFCASAGSSGRFSTNRACKQNDAQMKELNAYRSAYFGICGFGTDPDSSMPMPLHQRQSQTCWHGCKHSFREVVRNRNQNLNLPVSSAVRGLCCSLATSQEVVEASLAQEIACNLTSVVPRNSDLASIACHHGRGPALCRTIFLVLFAPCFAISDLLLLQYQSKTESTESPYEHFMSRKQIIQCKGGQAARPTNCT